ncbi:MAG: LacI family DNA-binding transcriptional regulator [Victivallales bacterium]|nr:LacI family DNA-binding transcriptional regulator [Victivallales bacterium]
MTNKRVTLKDIAAEAGVSVTLVSKYLNGRRGGEMSQETQKRVDEAISRLGYRPSKLARALRNGHTKTLGMVLANLDNPHFGTMAQSAYLAAEELGYELLLGITDYRLRKHGTDVERMATLMDHHVEGLYLTSHIVDTEFIRDLYRRHFPVVLSEDFDGKFSYTEFDVQQSCDDALAYLHSLGAKHIALLDTIHSPLVALPGISDRVEWMRKVTSRAENIGELCLEMVSIGCDSLLLGGGMIAEAFLNHIHDHFPNYHPLVVGCTDAAPRIPVCPELVGIIKRDYQQKVRLSLEELIRQVESTGVPQPIKIVLTPGFLPLAEYSKERSSERQRV